MSRNVMFCYSGTGNCLDMAKNIAKILGDTDIIMIRSAPAVTDVTSSERVGFVFPNYGGGLPGDMGKFLKDIRVAPSAYTFAVCQCAAYMGTGLHALDSVIPLDYWRVVTHQCAYIPLVPHQMMMPPMTPRKAQERSERKAREIAAAVKAGEKSEKKPPKRVVNKAEYKVWPVLAGMNAKKFTVSDECIGCGQCEKLCPTGNITLVNGKPTWGNNCYQCVSCLQYCPKEAISMGGATVKRKRYHNPNIPASELTEPIFHIN